jgi:hypothetical protein
VKAGLLRSEKLSCTTNALLLAQTVTEMGFMSFQKLAKNVGAGAVNQIHGAHGGKDVEIAAHAEEPEMR